MTGEKPDKQNRVREALGRLYEEYPPYFREYLRRYEEDPTSRVFAPLAEAYRKLGRLDDAISICREGLEHHPEFHGGRVALAKCLMEKGDLGGARIELERVVRVAPENLLAQRLLGDVTKGLGDTVSSLHAYKMALLLAPNDVALAEKVHELEHSSAIFLHTGGISPDGNVPISTTKAVESKASPEFVEDDDLPPLWATQNAQALVPDSHEEEALEAQGAEAEDSTPTDIAIEQLLGESDSVEDEAFKIEHISSIFDEESSRKKEITTETLGDLYFSQGQFERALKIFDKLPNTPELTRKIRDCKLRLGVDEDHLQKSRELALLRNILQKAQDADRKPES